MARLSLVAYAGFLLGLFLQAGVSGSKVHWSYCGRTGPTEWGAHYKDCNLMHQSPIDIRVSRTKYDPWLGPFKLSGYNKKQGKLALKNNGHSAQVDTLNGKWTVEFGSLKDKYKLLQFHFHCGVDRESGSEHTINLKRFPLEMHMVHMSTRFNDISKALLVKNSLAVLGVMFEVGGKDNPAFEELTNKLRFSKYKGLGTTLSKFAIRTLMPANLADYYTYEGSLTTPPCSEVVVWNIFRQTVKISEKQLNAFRRLKTFAKGHEPEEGEGSLSGNFRPLQPINGRIVRMNFFPRRCCEWSLCDC